MGAPRSSRVMRYGHTAAVLALLCGWLVNASMGFDDVRTLSVGESAAIAGAPKDGEKSLRSFSLLLQRLVADYGPLSIRIRVDRADAAGESHEIGLTEGDAETQVPGGNLHLQLNKFDDETGEIFLLSRTAAGTRELIFSLAGQQLRRSEAEGYTVTLISHRFALDQPRVRVQLGVLEGADIVLESWLERGESFGWRGVRISLASWGDAADGTLRAAVRVKKTPGRPFFWLGLFLFLGTLGLRWRLALVPSEDRGAAARDSLSGNRRWLFPATAVVVSFLLLEGGARVIEQVRAYLGQESNPYLEMRYPAPVFESVLENGRHVYRRTSHHRLILGNQTFLKEKPPNGYRVFLLGGSAAGGWPFAVGKYNLARFLERKLARLLPGRQVEVLNVAGGTFGSHRVKAVFDEVIGYQPDLVLIYTGNNEFLETFLFQRRPLPGVLNGLAVARLGWSVYDHFHRNKPSYEVDTYTARDQASNRIAFAFGKSSAYRRDQEQYRQVLAKYRYNVERMVKICKGRSIPVLLLNVPVNIRDWIPNASRHQAGLSAAALKVWQREFKKGINQIAQGAFPSAVVSLEQAVAVDEEHAETWYHLGVALLRSGRNAEAKLAFSAALEKDAYPFRALPRMQAVLREIAVNHRVPLVDSIGTLERLTPDGILGLDVLLDYVHPTIASQEAIAVEMLRVMTAWSMFPDRPALPVEKLESEPPYDFQPAVEARAVESMYNQYLIMRQYDKLDGMYRQYLETMERAMREDPTLEPFARRGMEIIRQIHPVLHDYSRLLQAEKLGELEEVFSKEEARRIYDRYIDLIRRLEAPQMSRESFLQQVPAMQYRDTEAAGPPPR